LEYNNEPYGLKVQYPYDWIIRINSNYSCHPSLVLPMHTLLAPFIYLIQQMDFHFSYVGIDSNLSEFKQYAFTLQQYLNKSYNRLDHVLSKTTRRSKHRTGQSRQYKDLIDGRFDINIVRIERAFLTRCLIILQKPYNN
jgi:hypothetical protein